MLFCMFSSVLYAFTSDDILSIAESAAPSFSGVFSIVKSTVLFLNKDKFFEIIDEIENLNGRWSQSIEHKETLLKFNNFSTKITKFLAYGCSAAGVFYNIKPIFCKALENIVFGFQTQYDLPFIAAYFFDAKKSPGYEIVYIIQACYTYFVVMITAAMGATFCCFCLNITAHFEILKNIINITEIKDFVEYHRKIIKLTQELCGLYKPIIFCEFITISIILCVTGLQILLYDDYGKIMTAILHSIAALTDVTVHSYGSQKILDSSMSICSDLNILDKDYIPIIIMSQKPLKFDSGLFDASMNTLSNMLSKTMSFITLLKSFVN